MVNETAITALWNAVDNEAETATQDERSMFVHYLRAWYHAPIYCDGTDVTVEQFKEAFRQELKGFDPTACSCRFDSFGHEKWCPMAR